MQLPMNYFPWLSSCRGKVRFDLKFPIGSLNDDLRIGETLERQRTTADDLQNVLYSTDVATIFLDTSFNIRFFTPATKALFNVIPGDVGRPLTDSSRSRSAARN